MNINARKPLFIIIGVLISSVLLFTALLTPLLAYTPPHSQPGPAVDKLIFKAFNIDIAATALEKGEMDFYLYSLKTLAAKGLAGNQNVKLYEAPATSIGLILNPAPAPTGQYNPFSNQQIRFAINKIIDRSFIAQQTYQGSAVEMLAHLSPGDYDYRLINSMLYEMDLSYQPDQAKATITQEMTAAGCTLVNNVWQYQGKPVNLIFIVRTEDERRTVGDTIATELRNLGFSVQVQYQQFAQAINKVYSADPALLQWHLYTEGWSKSGADKYDFGLINQMYAPWLGNMPGWQEQGYWQYTNTQLDTLGKQIYTGDFASIAQRDQIYKEMTQLAMQEAVRLWVVTVINNFATTSKLEGVTEDIAAGPRSILTLREAYISGKSELIIGNQWVWNERSTWNPVGGFGDVYSSDIWRNMVDPPLINDPFTGIPVEYRASFVVDTAGPAGSLAVPADAFLWNATAGKFASVGSGKTATSKVIFDYSKFFQSKWHNGQPIEMADLIYSIYQTFDMVYNPAKANIEFASATVSKPVLDTFKGFRILDANRIEVYVDYWHFVPEYIASYAVPSSLSMPWEILAAMDDLVFNKRQFAYSDTTAGRFSIGWLSLVNTTHAGIVRNTLATLRTSAFVPQLLFDSPQPWFSFATAQARYQADIEYFSDYNHLVISQGPFSLTRFESAAQYAELDAFRDPGYPFKPGDWYFGSPEQIDINKVTANNLEIGKAATIDIEINGPGNLVIAYTFYDPVGNKVLKSGQAQPSGSNFKIELNAADTQNLSPSIYYLYLLASTDEVSKITERRVDLDMASGGILFPDGTGGNDDSSGGMSPILIIIPIVVIVGGGLVLFILKGAGGKK